MAGLGASWVGRNPPSSDGLLQLQLLCRLGEVFPSHHAFGDHNTQPGAELEPPTSHVPATCSLPLCVTLIFVCFEPLSPVESIWENSSICLKFQLLGLGPKHA